MKNSCKYEILDISSSTDLEVSAVLIQDPIKMLLYVVYRHPNTSLSYWKSPTTTCHNRQVFSPL